MTISVDEVSNYVEFVYDMLVDEGLSAVSEYMDNADYDKLHIEEVCALLRVTCNHKGGLPIWEMVMEYARERLEDEGLDEKDYLAGMI